MNLASTNFVTSLNPQAGPIVGPFCHPSGCRGYGSPSMGVVLVGIAPGGTEMEKGRPFVGYSGKFMDSLLKMCSWPRELT